MNKIKELNTPLYTCDVKATTTFIIFSNEDKIRDYQKVLITNASSVNMYIKGSISPENITYPVASNTPKVGKVILAGDVEAFSMDSNYGCICVVGQADTNEQAHASIGEGE